MEKTKLKVRKREKSEIEELKALQVINKLASAEEKTKANVRSLVNLSHRVENFESEATSSSKT